MPTVSDALEELGRRVAAARIRQRYDVKAAAAAAGISRDTWKKIEQGMSVQDIKRAAALDFLGLDHQGLPVGGDPEDPGYVAAPGTLIESDVTNAQVLAELRAMREDVNALSRRVARIESGAQPVGGDDGPT